MNNLKNLNIDDIVAAVIADDADAAQIADSLKKSLQQAQAGEYSIAYTPHTIKIDGYHAVISLKTFLDVCQEKGIEPRNRSKSA